MCGPAPHDCLGFPASFCLVNFLRRNFLNFLIDLVEVYSTKHQGPTSLRVLLPWQEGEREHGGQASGWNLKVAHLTSTHLPMALPCCKDQELSPHVRIGTQPESINKRKKKMISGEGQLVVSGTNLITKTVLSISHSRRKGLREGE